MVYEMNAVRMEFAYLVILVKVSARGRSEIRKEFPWCFA